ncbi:MAG: DUF6638 family protein [Pseudomonadota bacterium]
MKHLIDSSLYFGDLMEIAEPHLVERYNEALTGFGLPRTELSTFRIDKTGYSPEVAQELDDPKYLDPKSVNRRFIILSPRQKQLPVVHTAFSNTSALMHEFFETNARAINTLTIKDVVYGEIEDSVFEASTIEDLLSIEQVEFKVYTSKNLSKKAVELRRLSDRLVKEPSAWSDDDLLNRMVSLAQSTGDIRNHDVVPKEVVFRHNAFWTELFGGLYIFVDNDQTTVIGHPGAPGFRRSRPWQVSYIDAADRKQIYRFLLETGRVDTPRGSWVERSGLIDHRINMLIDKLAFHFDDDLETPKSRARWRKNWVSKNSDIVEEEGTLPFMLWAKRELSNWSSIDVDELDTRGRFLLSRGRPGHPDQWLVNQLISDHVKFDYVSRFIFAKPSFYAEYRSWEKNYRHHVVDEISELYLPDKAGLRATLYDIED